MFGFVLDDGLRAALNERAQNYWDVYLQEMNEHLGLRGTALAVADLEQPQCLARLRSVVVGRQSGARSQRRCTRPPAGVGGTRGDADRFRH